MMERSANIDAVVGEILVPFSCICHGVLMGLWRLGN